VTATIGSNQIVGMNNCASHIDRENAHSSKDFTFNDLTCPFNFSTRGRISFCLVFFTSVPKSEIGDFKKLYWFSVKRTLSTYGHESTLPSARRFS
jgi:hypothetical protein